MYVYIYVYVYIYIIIYKNITIYIYTPLTARDEPPKTSILQYFYPFYPPVFKRG